MHLRTTFLSWALRLAGLVLVLALGPSVARADCRHAPINAYHPDQGFIPAPLARQAQPAPAEAPAAPVRCPGCLQSCPTDPGTPPSSLTVIKVQDLLGAQLPPVEASAGRPLVEGPAPGYQRDRVTSIEHPPRR